MHLQLGEKVVAAVHYEGTVLIFTDIGSIFELRMDAGTRMPTISCLIRGK